MTTTEVWAPQRRPVLRASLAIVVVAVLALAAWWSGVAAARIEVQSESFHLADPRSEAVLRVTNEAPTSIRIVSASASGPSFVPRLAGGPVTIPAGEERTIRILLDDPCVHPHDHLRLRVRTWVGMRHTVDADGFTWPDRC